MVFKRSPSRVKRRTLFWDVAVCLRVGWGCALFSLKERTFSLSILSTSTVIQMATPTCFVLLWCFVDNRISCFSCSDELPQSTQREACCLLSLMYLNCSHVTLRWRRGFSDSMSCCCDTPNAERKQLRMTFRL